MSYRPSISPFPNYESAVINTIAKVASLSFIVSRSMDHGLPHSLWHQNVPQTCIAVQTTDFNMASGGSTGYLYQHGLRQQHRAQTSTWFSVVTWVTDMNTIPSYSRITNPDITLGGSMDHRH